MLSFSRILNMARSRKPRPVAVSDGAGASVIKALKKATDEGMCVPHLVGDSDKIIALAKDAGLREYEIIHCTDPVETAKTAVSLVKNGTCSLLMKGKSDTKTLMQAVLDREKGLRTGNRMSHVAAVEVPLLQKVFFITDGGINPHPDLELKKMILANAVTAAIALGIKKPKAAVLCAQEAVKNDQPETLDAVALVEHFNNGGFPGLDFLEGPMATDVALSRRAATIKGIESSVSGCADILLVPDLASGNIMAKSILYLVPDRIFGGVVMGASCPIILLSRADEETEKYHSISLACAMV
ncbi:MAG: phosphate butyryltransferase [Candidatus Wallbacteria bacterium HGW-Wallbacteria-1]|jgi:phosphate butyryltransferase|uniref:Phosphate butyryltransferase n=1 Tax=Candidatus Wallbacteria bacterium HGW-Wallbacteria-1 TaxID=2013854 RepID=A0A2N1PQS0_9BACT|nr:MAG: phosphate butyryltransferase [Candidatus Wallbacteria bacterium HGW-Wallbacteria-1]